jgi:hypothetical protein
METTPETRDLDTLRRETEALLQSGLPWGLGEAGERLGEAKRLLRRWLAAPPASAPAVDVEALQREAQDLRERCYEVQRILWNDEGTSLGCRVAWREALLRTIPAPPPPAERAATTVPGPTQEQGEYVAEIQRWQRDSYQPDRVIGGHPAAPERAARGPEKGELLHRPEIGADGRCYYMYFPGRICGHALDRHYEPEPPAAPERAQPAAQAREKAEHLCLRVCSREHRGRGVGWACSECIAAALAERQAGDARLARRAAERLKVSADCPDTFGLDHGTATILRELLSRLTDGAAAEGKT